MSSKAVIVSAPMAERRALMEAHDLATWLYRYRKIMFCTQSEMAAEYGVGRSTYSEWERGVLPDNKHMIALCAYHPEWADRLALMWRVESAVREWHNKEVVEVRKTAETDGEAQNDPE